jgi:hypothetical protein
MIARWCSNETRHSLPRRLAATGSIQMLVLGGPGSGAIERAERNALVSHQVITRPVKAGEAMTRRGGRLAIAVHVAIQQARHPAPW